MAHKDVISAIDKEIARLQEARSILAGDETDTPVAKKRPGRPATKKAVAAPRKTSGKRVLSAEARKRIADAQKKRWAAQKAGK